MAETPNEKMQRSGRAVFGPFRPLWLFGGLFRGRRSLVTLPVRPLIFGVRVTTMRVAFEEFPMPRPGSCDGWAGRLGLRVVKRRAVFIFPLRLRDCTASMRQGGSLEQTIADVPTERRDFMAIWQTLSVVCRILSSIKLVRLSVGMPTDRRFCRIDESI